MICITFTYKTKCNREMLNYTHIVQYVWFNEQGPYSHGNESFHFLSCINPPWRQVGNSNWWWETFLVAPITLISTQTTQLFTFQDYNYSLSLDCNPFESYWWKVVKKNYKLLCIYKHHNKYDNQLNSFRYEWIMNEDIIIPTPIFFRKYHFIIKTANETIIWAKDISMLSPSLLRSLRYKEYLGKNISKQTYYIVSTIARFICQ